MFRKNKQTNNKILKMSRLSSAEFKSSMLLDLVPGDVLVIECNSYMDYESKAAACRSAFKRKNSEFIDRGISSLQVKKSDEFNVEVTVN